jgi:hypothetical protein
MRRKADAVYLGVVALAVFVIVGHTSAAVREGYKTPLFTIPYTSEPPTIDGNIRDDQWQGGLSINALQTTEGAVSTRQTRFWLMWDDDHLYLAMRSPLRPGERVLQANRRVGRDNSKTVFDDSYEIWLNFNTTSPSGEQVFFQYLGNAAGSKYDVMFEPTVGNSRPGWESGWKPVNRITPDGKNWEMEVAIPRQSVYRDQPFADGEQLQGLFVRNFKRPWEQNSVGGSGSFSAPDTHCRFILSKSAPAIHLLGVSDASTKSFGLKLAAFARDHQALKWSFESDGGGAASGSLDLTSGKLETVDLGLNLDHPGDGYYRIRVFSADGTAEYLDWSSHRTFGDFAALTEPIAAVDPANLTLSFNPVQNYVRVEGDFINYDNRAAIHRFSAEVLDSQGKQLAQQDLQLDTLAYVHGFMHLGDCPAGSYVARLRGYDADGKQIFQKESSFEKKDAAKAFPWWNTSAGDIEKVIAPWTAVRHNADQIDVWGRTMRVGSAGLPSQISTQGMDLLAGRMSLVAETDNGDQPAGDSQLRDDMDSDYRVVVRAASQMGDVNVSSVVTSEFDGMYKVQMTLSPSKPMAVKTLKVIVPIKPEFANYFHACGEGIRYGFAYGYLPAGGTGRLWDSKQVDGQPMIVGSFIPYVWIGNDRGGLCWFADSDEGWTPNDSVPAIEIRRDKPDSVDLVLSLISSDVTIDQPRTITFAFEATPVKPIRSGWRMDTWSTADSFKDWCQVAPRGGDLIWNALPFTLDTVACKKMVDERHRENSGYNFGIDKYRPNAVPYFENNGIGGDKNFAPEATYFGDQWRATVSSSLCYCKSLSDYIVWNLGKWCRETGIDGWYVDNVRPVADDNIDAGRGYRLPDGRIQPTYQMFATREFFLRVRAVFAENGKSGKFVLHMTHHMIMPWVGAADLALDGEDHVTFPDMGKDFIDFWSPERMRLDYPGPLGVAVTFLEEYQGAWKPAALHRVTRAYTAMSILNDVLPGANPNGQNQEVWRARDRFGIEADDVTFLPYWDKTSGLSCEGEGLYASAWRRPNRLLIAVVNTGNATTATVRLDLAKFGLIEPGSATVEDPETGAKLQLSQDGTIEAPIERHDYRQILLEWPVAPG